MSTPELGWLALDIGARTHAVAVDMGRYVEKHATVENTPQALGALFKRLKGHCGQLRVVMEATGVYSLDTALQAVAAGAQVMVLNPKQAHHFAKAIRQRNKTDAIDARMLLRYGLSMPFEPWQPPSAEALALRQYGRYLGQLVDQRTRMKNQLHALCSTATTPKLLIHDLKRAIAGLTQRIASISREARKSIHADAALHARYKALLSVIGIGPTSALSLLGELLSLPQAMTARACVCHAGLDVRIHQSGTSVARAPRLSKHGNKHLRRALFMPAMSAVRHDPHARAFRDRLLARGKKKLQAIVAVMRKMLTAVWALVRNPDVYDGARLYAAVEG